MEWPDFPLEESLYNLLSPPQPQPSEMPKPSAEWSHEENKLFENALAELDPSSPVFFESLASKVPWRSIDDVKLHYQALVQDIEMIESGNIPVPDYTTFKPDVELDPKSDEADSKTKSGQPRRRGVPWTEEEHQLFLMGLNKYGKGDWRSISRYYVISKTPTQVASHAQKYFRRQTSSTPADRRRPSIHDIHTVNPAATVPFPPCALTPTYNANVAGLLLDQNSGFLPQPVFNQAAPPSAPSTSSASFLPTLGNQYWG